MADVKYNHGARVLASDGRLVGKVDAESDVADTSGSFIVVRDENRLLSIPRSMIDSAQSSADAITLTDEFRLTPEAQSPANTTIPVHAEELDVRISEHEHGKVRIEKSVERVPVREDVELGSHVVDIERVASGEEFDEIPQNWHDGDTLVIPVVEEVLVLTRRYRVVENVRVTRRSEVRTETIEAELAREVVSFHEEDAEGNRIEPTT